MKSLKINDVVTANSDQSDDRVDLCERGERLVITDNSNKWYYTVLWEWLWKEDPKAHGFLIRRDEVTLIN